MFEFHTRCDSCGSTLIQPGPFVERAGRVSVERRCPECERLDGVVVSLDVARAWRERERALWEELADLADNVARADMLILEP
jgi:hypothetical protein